MITRKACLAALERMERTGVAFGMPGLPGESTAQRTAREAEAMQARFMVATLEHLK